MKRRTRSHQLVFGFVLCLPLIVAALTSGPFVSRPVAQAGNRMLGPSFPALVDTTGDGSPTEGSDTKIGLILAGTQLTIDSPWTACNRSSTKNVITLSNPDGQGRYQTLRRSGIYDLPQELKITAFTGGFPTGFDLALLGASNQRLGGGTGSVSDTNGDGAYDTVQGAGTQMSGPTNGFNLSLVFADVTGDAKADYVSVPWGQAILFGVNNRDGCTVAGADPQIWIPLADSNGDGTPDSIIPDLNGDGIADPQFFKSPLLVVAPPPVPTMDRVGLLVLTALLGALGIWSLRRRQAGTTASL
jgi:hypothetical protein